MKRKLIYFIVLLVILAGAIGPALYMNKVFSSNRQHEQAENVDINAEEQGNAVNQNQPAADTGEISPEIDKDPPAAETKQENPTTTEQQAGASNSTFAENAVPAQTSGDTTTAAPAESGCKVWIAIVGKNGELLYKAGQIVVKKDNKWGITALGALDTTSIPYTTMPTWPDFVASISGQANKGLEGWMYSVNGEVPMHMADKHPVKTGDKVLWWYSKSMERPMPQWEDLI